MIRETKVQGVAGIPMLLLLLVALALFVWGLVYSIVHQVLAGMIYSMWAMKTKLTLMAMG